MVHFGPSGNDVLFYKQGFKSSVQAPEWLAGLGLTAFEVNFGRGIRMSAETAKKIGDEAAKHNIMISAHAPYFINLASGNPIAIEKSYGYIEKTLALLKIMGGRDLVVHIGSQVELSRENAIKNCKTNLKWVMEKLDMDPQFKNFDYQICIETMGRYLAIGNYREVCEICAVHKRVVPTLDFGHINCLEQGGMCKKGAIEGVMDYCTKHLGIDKMKHIHIHFSPIKFGPKGELGHLNFEDAPEEFTPPFEPLARYIKAKKLEPTVICESSDMMAQDAAKLLEIFVES